MSETKTRKRWLAIAITCFAVLAIAGVAIAANVWDRKSSTVKTDQPVAPSALLVKTVQVDELSRPIDTQTFTGQVVARYDSNLAFRVAGKVVARHVEVGDVVNAGDVLLELESNDYELQLATDTANQTAADAAVKQAAQEEDRLSQLLRERAISQSDYDTVKLLLDSSLAKQTAAAKQTELARRQLEYVKLVADQDGIVVQLNAEVGQVITPGQPIVEVVRNDDIEIEVSLPEQFANQSSVQYASVQTWIDPTQSMQVRLRELSPIADSAARTFIARYSFTDLVEAPKADNASWYVRGTPLKLGMTINVAFNSNGARTTVAIPSTALSNVDGKDVVWAISNLVDDTIDTYSIEPIEVVVDRVGEDSVHVAIDPIQGRQIIAAGVQKLDRSKEVRLWTK
jgi:membrane fusion protein, multidrug efflux system